LELKRVARTGPVPRGMRRQCSHSTALAPGDLSPSRPSDGLCESRIGPPHG
jgi:hypothetical protein